MKIISIGTDRNIFDPESAVRKRAEEYASLFDELHIIVFAKQNDKFQITNIKNLFIYPTNSFSKIFYIKYAYKVAKKIIKERGLEISNTVVTTQDPFETGLVGLKLKDTFGFKLHVQVHTDIFSPYFEKLSILNRIRVKTARKILPVADAVRAVSERVKNSLQKELKLKSTPSVLPIYVDIQQYEHAEIKTDLKRKYPQFDFIMLVASRLSKEKNILLALTTVKKLIPAYPKLGLVIVGKGPEKEGLIYKARQLGISEHVVFEDWTDDVVSYYKTVDLFLITSWFEGYSMAIIEAVASHCAVVSTDVGIASEVLPDSVCPVGDEQCFFDTTKRLVENKDLRGKMIREASLRLPRVVAPDKKGYLTLYRNDIIRAVEAKN